jgi:phospholipid/cholesterol/gamma-HCH transport system permease protein
MPAAAQDEQRAHAEVRFPSTGHAVVTLTGRLDANSTAATWDEVAAQLRTQPVREMEIDASGVDYCDVSGMSLLHQLQSGAMTPGAAITLRGLRPEFEPILRAMPTPAEFAANRPPEAKPHLVEDVGRASRAMARDLLEELAFVGAATRAFFTLLVRPKQMRWREVCRVFEAAGADALPIVSLISTLVGLVIAFQSAGPLAQFGAQVFIADMIGVVMVRELGPVMTAIVLAGRSGSAFAAEIGTMKVNEELNALETMGLDPLRFLVVQRIMAGLLLNPLLTIYSMLAGVAGGVVVMLMLGFPLTIIYHQLVSAVHLRDLVFGTIKGATFGVLVAAIGCLRGLQTRKGPIAVGESTTRAVVTAILIIIIVDAVFAVIYYALF